MVMFCRSSVLALTSTLLVCHAAAAPLHQGTHQRRAVDVAALIHNQDRPAPAPQPSPPLEARAVNPEGFVPYMHFPSQTADPFTDKRAVNLEGDVPDQHDTKSPSHYDEEPVPFPRPRPQTQNRTGGDSESNGGGRRRASDPIMDNLLRKPVDVVPIVGRAVDPESFSDDGRHIVDVATIVERAVDPIVSDNVHRKPVDVVPVVGRAVDPIVSDNLHRKPVDVVPIVGRAVDVGAFVRMARVCGPDAQKYNPTEEMCDEQGVLHPLGSPMIKIPAGALSPGASKRDAIPEPQTDKMTCNGQRYVPSEQTCTKNGSLVNIQPVTPHNSKFTNPPVKRATSQCGSAIGSVQYDRATEYCDPITQQVWPVTENNDGSARILTGRPPLVPIAGREPAQERSLLKERHQPGSSHLAREIASEESASDQDGPFLCKSASKSTEYDPWTEDCDPTTGEVHPNWLMTSPVYSTHAPRPDLVPAHGVTRRQGAKCGDGVNSIVYDADTQSCNPRTGEVSVSDDDSNGSSAWLVKEQSLTSSQTTADYYVLAGAKREAPKSPVKLPFWEYWYDDTYDSDVDGEDG